MSTKKSQLNRKVVEAEPQANGTSKLDAALDKAEKMAQISNYSPAAGRALFESYYSVQEERKRMENRIRAVEQGADVVPHDALYSLLKHYESQEKEMEAYLTAYASANPMGRWAMQFKGISGVLAAGLLCFIDFHYCSCPQYKELRRKHREQLRSKKRSKDLPPVFTPPPHKCVGLHTYGKIHQYAGLVPKEFLWEKDPKTGKTVFRKYNAAFKTFCWKIGKMAFLMNAPTLKDEDEIRESLKEKAALKGKKLTESQLDEMVESQLAKKAKKENRMSDPAYFYSNLYWNKKAQEKRKNEQGGFAQLAASKLAESNERRGVKNRTGGETGARATWKKGRIQDGGVDQRARNYAVKLFLSHYHALGYIYAHGKPSKVPPYPFAKGGHSNYIPPPLWPADCKVTEEEYRKAIGL